MSSDDAEDLRRDIQSLREQMIRVEEGQKAGQASLDRLNQSFGKHEAEDDARFARHESGIWGENGAMPRIGKIEDYFKMGRWAGRIAAGATIAILGVMVWVLYAIMQMQGKIGAP